ncbi:MAG: RluA family pseudouridine synthase [Chlamydiia bacterium]|nr:RluA family pseudouridine synthase [Chlamydiia bacterium]
METALTISDSEAGLRLDKLLALRFDGRYSRTYFQYLIDKQLVLVNGVQCKKRLRVESGDEVEIEFALTPEIDLEPEPIPLDIIFEDEHFLAVNKPPGLVVHPAPGNWSGTFVNALLHHCQTLPAHAEPTRPGIVHRLDKETSGLLLAAKNQEAQVKLVEMFASRKICKEYLALCYNHPKEQTIELPIGRHPKQRKKMAVVTTGKEAVTALSVIQVGEKLSFIRLLPKTGRTHQIRVHLQAIGCPLLGDPLYGVVGQAPRQMLHAEKLSFLHPTTREPIRLFAPIPEDMKKILLDF